MFVATYLISILSDFFSDDQTRIKFISNNTKLHPLCFYVNLLSAFSFNQSTYLFVLQRATRIKLDRDIQGQLIV